MPTLSTGKRCGTILNNMHCFARDQAILVQPDSPRYLGNRLKQWRA